jgi:ferrous-iron efflux pump FieF
MESPEKASRLMRRAAIASVCVALTLTLLKAGAYLASNSVAMLASMADSGLDLLASAANYVAIRQALTPADREHRFGHGKAEPLAGLAQSAFIVASALFLVVQSVGRLTTPTPVENSGWAMAVMGVSIAMTLALLWVQNRAVAASRSTAIRADRAHYVGDLAGNAAVIVAILLAGWFGWLWADPLFALGVAALLLHSAWTVGRDSLDQLMDRELPDEERARIARIIASHPAVTNVHDLKTRTAGLTTFIQAHIVLDGALSLREAHAVTEGVEMALLHAWPGAQVIIHQDPSQPQPAASTA